MKRLLYSIKGFSIIEILISIIAFGLFAVLVQSVLVIGHSFQQSQKNFMNTIQLTSMLKQTICLVNASFRTEAIDRSKSYQLKTTQIGNKPEESYIQRAYNKIPNSSANATGHFLNLDIDGIQSETSASHISTQVGQIIASEKAKSSSNQRITFSGQTPSTYRILQDSHTFIKLHIDDISLGSANSANLMEGYIFASRCVKNKPDRAIKDKKNKGAFFTFDRKALKQSALYILEEKRRPYYFSATNYQVQSTIQCCEDGETNCGPGINNADWVPRIYIIYIKSQSSTSGFTVKVENIQEEPSFSDLNEIWGAGFILTTNFQFINRGSIAFKLDVMFLRNRCSTSPGHISRCPFLQFGVNPSSLLLSASQSSNMGEFIYPDVTGCSGYSNGLGSTSPINF